MATTVLVDATLRQNFLHYTAKLLRRYSSIIIYPANYLGNSVASMILQGAKTVDIDLVCFALHFFTLS